MWGKKQKRQAHYGFASNTLVDRKRVYNAKLKLTNPVAFTGWPSRTKGLKCHLRIASLAADCKRPGPVTFWISATFPCSSTRTVTVTIPVVRRLLAGAG